MISAIFLNIADSLNAVLLKLFKLIELKDHLQLNFRYWMGVASLIQPAYTYKTADKMSVINRKWLNQHSARCKYFLFSARFHYSQCYDFCFQNFSVLWFVFIFMICLMFSISSMIWFFLQPSTTARWYVSDVFADWLMLWDKRVHDLSRSAIFPFISLSLFFYLSHSLSLSSLSLCLSASPGPYHLSSLRFSFSFPLNGVQSQRLVHLSYVLCTWIVVFFFVFVASFIHSIC